MATVKRVKNLAAYRALDGLVALGRFDEKVGWFQSAKYPNGVPVALVAAVNEFGWPEHNIPPRLGMRATAEASRDAWRQVADMAARGVAKGTMTPQKAMELIGLKAAGDVRKHISEVRQPPLKVATVEARLAGKKQGSVVAITASKPLVRTGHLLNTLTNVTEPR